jgi:hypothetical protein
MRTKFKPLKKFPALIRCISLDDKNSTRRGMQVSGIWFWRDIKKEKKSRSISCLV